MEEASGALGHVVAQWLVLVTRLKLCVTESNIPKIMCNCKYQVASGGG